MDPLIGYKSCTNSRTLVQEYLSYERPLLDRVPQLYKTKDLHSTDSIDTETSGTRGLSIWVHSS